MNKNVLQFWHLVILYNYSISFNCLNKSLIKKIPFTSLKKAKQKLKELTSRSQGRNVRQVMKNVKVFIRGWLGYFGIAEMRNKMKEWDDWVRRRFRCYIWKQWKRTYTRKKALVQLGMKEWQAWEMAKSRKSYWRMSGMLNTVITNKRLAQAGYYSILDRYESMHLIYG